MGPDGVGGCAIALGIAGIIDIDEVDGAVVVVVVEIKVDTQRVVGIGAGLDHHLVGTDVGAVDTTIRAVVGHVVLQLDGTHDIEGGLEKAVGLVDIVIATGAGGTVIAETFFVHLAREEALVVVRLKAVVGKLDQQDETTNLTRGQLRINAQMTRRRGLGTAGLSHELLLLLGIEPLALETAIGHGAQEIAIAGNEVMAVLIAHEAIGDRGAVGERGLMPARPRRHGLSRHRRDYKNRENEKSCYTVHCVIS